jgi:predicted nucleic acid-binding protein
MIVLDAFAAVDWLLRTAAGQRMEHRIYSHSKTLHSTDLFNLEVAQVLRRLVIESAISVRRAAEAIDDLSALRISRYRHDVFLPRIWHHRNNLSACDAAYVCLAEDLAAPLITRDNRLATAPGHTARIEVF